MRTLVDLNPVPFPGDQIVAAFRALHAVRLALGLARGLLRRRALLPQQLGVAPREVFVFVLTRTPTVALVRLHGLGGAGGGVTWSVSPPGLAKGTRPGGDDDSPEDLW